MFQALCCAFYVYHQYIKCITKLLVKGWQNLLRNQIQLPKCFVEQDCVKITVIKISEGLPWWRSG